MSRAWEGLTLVSGEPSLNETDEGSGDEHDIRRVRTVAPVARLALGGAGMITLEGSVLLIEDDPIDAELVLRGLARIPQSELDVRWVTSLGAAREAIAECSPEIVLTDLILPDARGLEVLTALVALCGDSSLIVQTGVDDAQTPIKALELGAQDFLRKGSIDGEVLGRAIRYALARNLARSDLMLAERERDRSARDLDGFADVVAHDLRAPVRTARLFADRLLHELQTDDELVIDYGVRLTSSLEKVDRMILSMLDYASLRGSEMEAAALDASAVMKQCVQLVRGDLDEADGEITIECDADLFVVADEEQLSRVLLNVLANSVKYRSDGRRLEIHLGARSVGDAVYVDVIDNGTGIDEEQAERAFQVLERLDPRRADGLGFGLAISRRIVHGFGGTISFVHDQPHGAHVEIVLPGA